MLIEVSADGWLSWSGGRVRAALGRCGVTGEKREGDGCTPAGIFLLRRVLYRPDRLSAPATRLDCSAIGANDGWSDDPADPAYNSQVTLPRPARHERLWREDGLYDLVVALGYNDDPAVPGLGSAIFLHVAHPDLAPTEGCVAVSRGALSALLRGCGPETWLAIHLDDGAITQANASPGPGKVITPYCKQRFPPMNSNVFRRCAITEFSTPAPRRHSTT